MNRNSGLAPREYQARTRSMAVHRPPAVRSIGYGRSGEPAPVHPHLVRHARVRQIVRHTKSLALAQKQAGWARLHTEYLTLSDDEARRLMQDVTDSSSRPIAGDRKSN